MHFKSNTLISRGTFSLLIVLLLSSWLIPNVWTDDNPAAAKRAKALKKEISVLIGELGNDKPALTEEAREEILKIGLPTVPLLLKHLKKGDTELRYLICEILGELRDQRAVKSLIKILKNETDEVAAAAARALGYLADYSAVPPLMEALDSPDVELRYESIRALGILRAKEAETKIQSALKDTGITNFDYLIKCAAIEALGRLQSKDAVQELIPLLNDQTIEKRTDKPVNEYVLKTLEKITGHNEGSIYSANEKEKEAIIKKWASWWEKHKTEYGVVPPPEEKPVVPSEKDK